MRRSRSPLLALVAVTAIWGYTFVPVQKSVGAYPLFAFLAVRFAISTLALAPFAWRPLRALAPRRLGGRGRRRHLPRSRLRPPDRGPRADDGREHGFHHRPLRRLHAAARPRGLPNAGAGARVDRRRLRAGGASPSERRPRWLVGREPARARERRRAVLPDRRDGTVGAPLRRAGADDPPDGRRVRRVRGGRARGRTGRGAARCGDVVRARRDRRLRGRARLPRRRPGCSRGRRRRARRSCSRSRRRSRPSSACCSCPSASAGPGGRGAR